MSTDDTTTALTKSVLNMDASRRVGWAKAFSAEASADDLARQVNIATSERDIFRRYAGYVTGFLQRYSQEPLAPLTQTLIDEAIGNRDAVLDSVDLQNGRELAAAAIRGWSDAQADRADRQLAKKGRVRESSRLYKDARQSELRRLAARYGFANGREFESWCDEFFGALGTFHGKASA